MSTLHDDQRLTAYALGELTTAERIAFEQQLAIDPALRAEVEQIRALSGDLAQCLGAELRSAPALTPPQRAAIAQAAAAPAPAGSATAPPLRARPQQAPRHPFNWRLVVGWGACASVAAAGLALLVMPAGMARAPAGSLDMKPVAMSAAEVAATPPDVFSPAPVASPVLAMRPSPVAAPAPLVRPAPVAPELLARNEKDATSTEPAASGTFMAIGAGQGGGRRSPSAPAAASVTQDEATASSDAAERKAPNPAPPFTAYAARSPAPVASPVPPSAPASEQLASRGERPAADYKRAAPGAAKPATGLAPTPPPAGFRLAPAAEPSPAVVAADGEAYNQRSDHGFLAARSQPLSTFGLDVDTASYGNVRRMIEGGRLPPRDAVRVEELVNYFPYDVPAPTTGEAFGVTVEVSACPWAPAHQLARIAVRAKDLAAAARPALNLVFLVDVSGSMRPDNRLPLIKTGLSLLTTSLREQDHIAIVTYANSAGVALPRTAGSDQRTILKAIDALNADGGTNGGSGIQLAYQAAREGFVPGGANRVILCTDGDFNVGVTDRGALVRLAQERAQQGIFLTVLGVGQDNLKDATMELLADRANGNYHYLDTIAEARKVLVEQLGGTLVTVAKDVKAQVEFNPARIAAWRQLGYEKRAMAARDFADDRKDAGEIGAGHLVTMLYELVPAGVAAAADGEGLRYQADAPAPAGAQAPGHVDELITVKLRFKEPTGDTSRLIQGVVTDALVRHTPSDDQAFAAAVAAFAQGLRGSQDMPLDLGAIRALAASGRGRDPQGYRQEFIALLDRLATIQGWNLPRE